MVDIQAGDAARQSFLGATWDNIKSDLSAEAGRAAADVGSTFQACLYSGWHTQSASIDSPEHISGQLARDAEQKKLEPEPQAPRVGLEKE